MVGVKGKSGVYMRTKEHLNKLKGRKPSIEQRKKQSEALKGRHVSPKSEFKKGKEHRGWKGGRTKHNLGYINININGKIILEHHLVWLRANQLYRIPSGCVIHHCDGNKSNNSIDNLQLMTRGFHNKIHNTKLEVIK